MNIANKIGKPALLEQCAEECSILSAACISLAKNMRNENPAATSYENVIKLLNNSMAGVSIFMDEIMEAGIISHESVESLILGKAALWEKIIKEAENK